MMDSRIVKLHFRIRGTDKVLAVKWVNAKLEMVINPSA
jgi:hypothetical protein